MELHYIRIVFTGFKFSVFCWMKLLHSPTNTARTVTKQTYTSIFLLFDSSTNMHPSSFCIYFDPSSSLDTWHCCSSSLRLVVCEQIEHLSLCDYGAQDGDCQQDDVCDDQSPYRYDFGAQDRH